MVKRRPGAAQPLPDKRPAEQLAHEGEPRALVLPEGPDRALAVADVALAGGLVVAVEQVGIVADAPVRADQRVRGDRPAALAGDHDLAFGDDGGREVQQQRRAPVHRDTDAIGCGGEAPLGTAEGCHQRAACRIHEVHRDQALLGRHLGPVRNPADVAGVAQPDRREPHRFALVDADLHRQRRDSLAEAELAVDYGQHRGVHHHLDLLVREQHSLALHLHVARDARDPVAVVAGQVGGDEVAGDALGFGTRAAGGDENVGGELLQLVCGYRDHGRHDTARPTVLEIERSY